MGLKTVAILYFFTLTRTVAPVQAPQGTPATRTQIYFPPDRPAIVLQLRLEKTETPKEMLTLKAIGSWKKQLGVKLQERTGLEWKGSSGLALGSNWGLKAGKSGLKLSKVFMNKSMVVRISKEGEFSVQWDRKL